MELSPGRRAFFVLCADTVGSREVLDQPGCFQDSLEGVDNRVEPLVPHFGASGKPENGALA